ncbi:PfkB family carbohydrate kinase [Leifsonia poae]|uniref:PfkB family carbohydrate kinase n=1 Tax=Leifsonia poae TaxID=110933 RepID=UPI001CBF0749|nr:PfkB family carbohydrate kinase [Leifsonia poae]
MPKVVGVRGGLSLDHLVTVGAGARFDELGGPGLFGALGARLVAGATAALCTNLPADDGRFARLFGEVGVDLSSSETTPSVPRVWILNAPEGRRIVETASVSSVELEGGEPREGGSEAAAVALPAPVAFYDRVDALLESSPTERPPVRRPIPVGLDPHQLPLSVEGITYLERVSPTGAVILPSRVQLRLLNKDPRAAAREMSAALGLPVIARLDSEGMYVVAPSGVWSVRDAAVRVVETTGAGDSSAAAIVAALAVGADLVTAAQFGVSVARLALSDWGHAGLLASDPLTAPLNTIESNQEL